MGTESDLKVRTDTLEVWQENTVHTTQHKKKKKRIWGRTVSHERQQTYGNLAQ